MGRAKIVEHIADSEYSVIYYHDMTKINFKILKIEEAITSTVDVIATTETAIEQEQEDVSSLAEEVDALIITFNICLAANVETLGVCDPQKEAVKKKNIAYMLALSDLGASNKKLDNLKIKLERLKKDLISYDGLTGEEVMAVWCIDLCDRNPADPDNNHGEIIPNDTIVGTVDIFDFSTRKYHINIRAAAYERDPIYNSSFDGEAGHSLASDGNGFVYNYNMRGPQSTWNPKYRLAIINSITKGIAQITYNAQKDQDGVKFNTNDSNADNDVPVDYMKCSDAPPFENGDQVIVSFTGDKMLSPSIIGYAIHPQACPPLPFLYTCPIASQTTFGWGLPFYTTDDPPVTINPPFGTTFIEANGNINTRHKRARLSADITTLFGEQHLELGAPEMMGNNYWSSDGGSDIVSWWGRGGNSFLDYGYCEEIMPGDQVLSREYNAGDDIYEYYLSVIVSKKTGVSCTTSLMRDHSALLANYNISDVATLSADSVWHNGTKIALQGLTGGTYGSLIIGACIYAGHLVYLECLIDKHNGYTSVYDRAHSIRLSDLSYAFLGTYQARLDEDAGDNDYARLMHNASEMKFSGDGSKVIGHKGWTQFGGSGFTSEFRQLTGFMGYDSGVDTVSISISSSIVDTTDSEATFAAWNYGYDENDFEVFEYLDGTNDHHLNVYYSNPKFNCVVGIYEQNLGAGDFEPQAIIVQWMDKLWEINIASTSPAYSTNDSIWSDFYGYSEEALYIARTYPGFSCVAFKEGVLLSMGAAMLRGNNISASTPNNYNVWIKPDGTVVDLGEALLNSSVNGNSFCCRPMVVNR